ncbi:hypothetical protein [Sodalis sp.]|uniref:hypothetical protein n=1 Tax=Sodalis sp. (in: enterobacteria) TaxID=1898979 RepID=UPI003873AAE9
MAAPRPCIAINLDMERRNGGLLSLPCRQEGIKDAKALARRLRRIELTGLPSA